MYLHFANIFKNSACKMGHIICSPYELHMLSCPIYNVVIQIRHPNLMVGVARLGNVARVFRLFETLCTHILGINYCSIVVYFFANKRIQGGFMQKCICWVTDRWGLYTDTPAKVLCDICARLSQLCDYNSVFLKF